MDKKILVVLGFMLLFLIGCTDYENAIIKFNNKEVKNNSVEIENNSAVVDANLSEIINPKEEVPVAPEEPTQQPIDMISGGGSGTGGGGGKYIDEEDRQRFMEELLETIRKDYMACIEYCPKLVGIETLSECQERCKRQANTRIMENGTFFEVVK